MSKLRNIPIMAGLFLFIFFCIIISCDKDDGDRQPLPPINITIFPNSTLYQEINFVGGWIYLTEQDGAEPPSRGIIVYRLTDDQFLAYERTPPYKPDSCCNSAKTICSSLIVDYPMIKDTCTHSTYSILDGSPISGPSSMTLSMYVTEYYGDQLFIHD